MLVADGIRSFLMSLAQTLLALVLSAWVQARLSGMMRVMRAKSVGRQRRKRARRMVIVGVYHGVYRCPSIRDVTLPLPGHALGMFSYSLRFR